MKTLLKAALLLVLASSTARAQVNAGNLKPEPNLPFTLTQVTTFDLPWRIAFLPDGRMLVTEKVGPIWLVTQQGQKTQVANVPAVLAQGQGGMLGVFVSPRYATDHSVYLTYSEPGDVAGASGLALARARLNLDEDKPSLEGLQVLWHDMRGTASDRTYLNKDYSPSRYQQVTTIPANLGGGQIIGSTRYVFPSFVWGSSQCLPPCEAGAGTHTDFTEVQETVSITTGTHTYKFGGSIQIFPTHEWASANVFGTWTFAQDQYFNPDDPNFSFANLRGVTQFQIGRAHV